LKELVTISFLEFLIELALISGTKLEIQKVSTGLEDLLRKKDYFVVVLQEQP
jgi:hypothetical protein